QAWIILDGDNLKQTGTGEGDLKKRLSDSVVETLALAGIDFDLKTAAVITGSVGRGNIHTVDREDAQVTLAADAETGQAYRSDKQGNAIKVDYANGKKEEVDDPQKQSATEKKKTEVNKRPSWNRKQPASRPRGKMSM